MQLTNIARDVVEDEKKNRIYLIKKILKIHFLDIKKLSIKPILFTIALLLV